MHTVISALSPQDRDAWLDKLLSASVADGVAVPRHRRGSDRRAGDGPSDHLQRPPPERHGIDRYAAVTVTEPDAEDQRTTATSRTMTTSWTVTTRAGR